MPTPRHLRHPPATLSPSPYHPHPLSPPPQHTPPARHALPARHTRPLHTHLTTPYLLPFILYLFICTSPQPPTAHCDPILSTSLPPFRTQLPTLFAHALTPSSAPHNHPSTLLPTPPLRTLRALFRGKVCTPPPKASSNPPVEIFCSKRRRRLILNILPRQHRVDNSVSNSVHSEEKA